MNIELMALATILVVVATWLWWPMSSRVERIAQQQGNVSLTSPAMVLVYGKMRLYLGKIKTWLVLRRTYTRRRSASIEFLGALSAELSVGQPLVIAFDRAANSVPISVCPLSLAASRMGGDIAESLRLDAERERLPALRALSALWQVSDESGASLANAVDRLAQSQLESEEVRGTLQAELAGPKATAKVLAGLPILGLILGGSLGGDPVAWLTTSMWGIAVLIVGIGLEVLGILWVSRMMHSVERRL